MLCCHLYNSFPWLQGSDDKPYEPLTPTQSPIKPPYETACKLKKTNLLDASSHTVDLQTTSEEARREDNAGTSQEISSVGPLTGTSGETIKSLQQQELPSLVALKEEEQSQ